MRKHFQRKNICPKSANNIDLTDDIKAFILENRVYHVPKDDRPSIINQINTVNNYQTINNYIATLDPIVKLQKYIAYNKVELIDFDQSIEERYNKKSKRLENNSYKYGFELSLNDLYEIIDEISNIFNEKSMDYFNIIYDKCANKLKIYDQGVWQDSLLVSGLIKVITTIQAYYLDAYETFLIRNIKSVTIACRQKMVYRERLKDYYKFIGCFDVPPFVKDKADHEILGTEGSLNSFDLHEEFYPVYTKIRDASTKSDINNIKKCVVDIIKRNSSKNINDLNAKVVALFHIDDEFQKEFPFDIKETITK